MQPQVTNAKQTAVSPATSLSNTVGEKLMTRKQVRELFGWSQSTFTRRNREGNAPPMVRIGGSVRYRPEVVRQFILDREGK